MRSTAEDPPLASSFDWSLCRTFLAVLRRRSVAAAVRDLGISHATARRQLGRLDEVFGAALFSRSSTGVQPTPLAVRLAPYAEEMETAASLMCRLARWEGVAGKVRLAIATAAAELVAPTLATISRAHPRLRLEVVVTGGTVDLMGREVDISLAAARPTQEAAICSRIGSVRLGIFADRTWTSAHGTPHTLIDLVGTGALVGLEGRDDVRGSLLWGERTLRQEDFALLTPDAAAASAAIAAGLGAGPLPLDSLATRPVLVRLLPHVEGAFDLWLSTHPDLRDVPQVRAVLDGLRAGLAVSTLTSPS